MQIRPRGFDDGAALIEAALVLPVLLVLVLGLADISLYLWNAALVTKTAQLGARRAVVSQPVAMGPGLEATDPVSIWQDIPPGVRCYRPSRQLRAICPDFSVACNIDGCRCTGALCMFRFSAARFATIVGSMQIVLPELTAKNVEIVYATNGFGYATRPGAMSVDIQVTVKDQTYKPLFLHGVLGRSLPLTASVSLPSQSLGAPQ